MPAKKPKSSDAALTPEEEEREAERAQRRKPPKPPAHIIIDADYAKEPTTKKPKESDTLPPEQHAAACTDAVRRSLRTPRPEGGFPKPGK